MAKVRRDENGLYIISDGYKVRPGRMDQVPTNLAGDGGVKEGATVRVYHPAGPWHTVTTPAGKRWWVADESLLADGRLIWEDKHGTREA